MTKIIAYQTHLQRLGLYLGVVDGIVGPQTIAAIKQFQALIGNPQTGELAATQSRQLQSFGLPARTAENDAPIAFPHDDTESLTQFYGKPGAEVEAAMVYIDLPYPLEIVWQPGTFVTRIKLHKRCAAAFQDLFSNILAAYGQAAIRELKLDQFGGAYNNRVIRGGTRPSTHAFACAVDLAPAQNQLTWGRDKALFAKPAYIPFHRAIKSAGLTNLGVARNYDWMHIQAAWI